jgi:hypothetical protein
MAAAAMATMALHFTWIALTALLVYVGLIHCFKRRHQCYQEEVGNRDGLLVLPEWGPICKGCALTFLLIVVLVPSLMFVVAFLFAGILAACEGWTYFESFMYVLGNMVGVGPLVNIVPSGAGGITLDIVASMWSMLLTSTILGLSASISLFDHINSLVPSSFCGLLRVFLIYLPLCLGTLATGCGALLALLEDWSVANGLLFMLGSLCGIQDPLTEVSPSTDAGNFFVIICFCLELSLGGAIIGIVGSHPCLKYLIVRLEGDSDDADSSASEAVGAGKEAEQQRSTIGEAAAQQKIRQLEQALEAQQRASALRVASLEQTLELQRKEWLEAVYALQRREGREGSLDRLPPSPHHGSPHGNKLQKE